jgi:FixJ family two-component response regulator
LRKKPFISIVDDDESVRETTKSLMRSMGFSAEAFSSGAEFLASPLLSRTACLVSDVKMPGMSGLELHRRLLDSGNNIPIILITAYPDEGVKARALNGGALCCLTKPFSEEDLLACIHAALGKSQTSGG